MTERARNRPIQPPAPIRFHSEAAQKLMDDDAFWMPHWVLDAIKVEGVIVEWQVMDSYGYTAKCMGRGETDVLAVVDAIEKERSAKP